MCLWGSPYQGSRLPGWAIMCVSALKWVHRSQWCIWQHPAASMVGNKWYWNWTNSGFDSQIKWCSSKRAQERCGRENQHLSLFSLNQLCPTLWKTTMMMNWWYLSHSSPWISPGWWKYCWKQGKSEMSLMREAWNQVICSDIFYSSNNHVSFKYLLSCIMHLRPYFSLIRKTPVSATLETGVWE